MCWRRTGSWTCASALLFALHPPVSLKHAGSLTAVPYRFRSVLRSSFPDESLAGRGHEASLWSWTGRDTRYLLRIASPESVTWTRSPVVHASRSLTSSRYRRGKLDVQPITASAGSPGATSDIAWAGHSCAPPTVLTVLHHKLNYDDSFVRPRPGAGASDRKHDRRRGQDPESSE